MINFATATPTELAAAGYTLSVKRSQIKSRRRSKWVRPSCNCANPTRTSLANANQISRGEIAN